MGEIRSFSRRTRWTAHESAVLCERYSSSSREELLQYLPGRTFRTIQCKANALGLARDKPKKRTAMQTREAKRVSMAHKRASDPEAARSYQRERHYKDHETSKAKMRAYAARRFFWNRQMHLDGPHRATARELAALWRKQKGCCALTGRRLSRSAHLDHIVARARGGGDEIGNLRWVCAGINYAKRDLSDDELIALCGDVMAWIGQRIQMLDSIHCDKLP